MRKAQVRKNPRDTLLTPKQDDNTSKSLELSEGQLEAHFRRLNLAHTRRIYKEVADRAEKEGWSYRDFLALLLAEEVARRKTDATATLYAERTLPVLQDHRRVRLRVAVNTPGVRDRLLPRAGLRHRGAVVDPPR